MNNEWISIKHFVPDQDSKVIAMDMFEEIFICHYDEFWGFILDDDNEIKIFAEYWKYA